MIAAAKNSHERVAVGHAAAQNKPNVIGAVVDAAWLAKAQHDLAVLRAAADAIEARVEGMKENLMSGRRFGVVGKFSAPTGLENASTGEDQHG